MLKPGGSWSKSGGSGGSSRAAGGPQPNWANSCSASCRYCWTSAVRGDAQGASVTRGARLAMPCVIAPSVSGARGAADGAAATAGAADSAGRVGVCIVSARGGASASSRPEGGVSSLALGEPAATAPEPCISTRLRRLRRGGSGPTGRLLMSIRYCISHEGRSRMGKPSRAAATAWSSALVGAGGRASLANTLRRRLPSLLVSARGVLRRASGRGMVASRWCWACGLGSDAAPGTEDGRAGAAPGKGGCLLPPIRYPWTKAVENPDLGRKTHASYLECPNPPKIAVLKLLFVDFVYCEACCNPYWCAAAPPSTPCTRPRVRSCPGAWGGPCGVRGGGEGKGEAGARTRRGWPRT